MKIKILSCTSYISSAHVQYVANILNSAVLEHSVATCDSIGYHSSRYA